jgi:hypothetical protein
VFGVLGDGDGGDRAEGFLVKRRHAGSDVGQDRRRVVVAGAVDLAAAERESGAGGDRAFDLLVQFVAQVVPRHGTDGGRGVERIAGLHLPCGGDEFAGEFFGDRRFQDEALGRQADLAGILKARLDAGFHRQIDVGVRQDDEGIGAAQLQQALFKRLAGGRRDGGTGAHTAGECHRRDARILDDAGDGLVVGV